MGARATEPRVDEAEAADCARCGAPIAARQEYCLECGARLPDGDFGRTPLLLPARGDWLWPVLAGAVVTLVALAVVVAVRAAEREPREALVATTAMPEPEPMTLPPEAPATTVPTLPPEPTTERERTTTASEVGEWPEGKEGWTVILASVPVGRGRQPVRERAREAADAGLERVGVLESDDYPSLHPGYYVVFSGVYDSRSEAERALSDVHERGYEDAYIGPIVP